MAGWLIGFPHPAHWEPRLGDNDAAGWVAVGGYVVAAGTAVLARRRAPATARELGLDLRSTRRLCRVWTVVALVALVFGLNKQLDLQTWALDRARRVFWEHGWYQDRREVQAVVILALAVAGLVTLWIAVRAVRPIARHALGAIVGLVLLAVFVLVRAVSLHQVDRVLGLGPVRLSHVLELASLAVLVAAGWRFLLGGRRSAGRVRSARSGPHDGDGARGPLGSGLGDEHEGGGDDEAGGDPRHVDQCEA